MKHIYKKHRCVPTAVYPIDVPLSQRLRNYKELGVQNAEVANPWFDDAPDSPTDNMEVDPLKDPYSDPFAMAETLGSEMVKAKASSVQAEPAGASSTPPKEVND